MRINATPQIPLIIKHIDQYGWNDKFFDICTQDVERIFLEIGVWTKDSIDKRNKLFYEFIHARVLNISSDDLQGVTNEIKTIGKSHLASIENLCKKGELELILHRGGLPQKNHVCINRELQKHITSTKLTNNSLIEFNKLSSLDKSFERRVIDYQDLTPRQHQVLTFLADRACMKKSEIVSVRNLFKNSKYKLAVFKSKEYYEAMQEKSVSQLGGLQIQRLENILTEIQKINVRFSVKVGKGYELRVKRLVKPFKSTKWRVIGVHGDFFGGDKVQFVKTSSIDFLTLKNAYPKTRLLTSQLTNLFHYISIQKSYNAKEVKLRFTKLANKIGMDSSYKNKGRNIEILEKYLLKLKNHEDISSFEKSDGKDPMIHIHL